MTYLVKPEMARMEAEANAFAFELLMPAAWVRADYERMGGLDVEDERRMTSLAKRYRVSVPVMTLRLGQVVWATAL